MRSSLAQTYEHCIQANGIHLGKHEEYIINYFTSGYISTLHDWLKKEDCSAMEIAAFLLGMISMFAN